MANGMEQEIEATAAPGAVPAKPNKQNELVLNSESAGTDGEIRLTANVIAKIARRATLAVEGVARFCPKSFSDIKNIFSARSYDSSMVIDFLDGKVNLTLSVFCYFGAKIRAVCNEVQKQVREQVESQGGAQVGTVTVLVKDLLDPEEKVSEVEAEAEEEVPEEEKQGTGTQS